jgi:two-component system chemotaxis response regulator CheB
MSTKVFVVDDSAVVRQTLMHLLKGDASIELIGSAPNPIIAAPAIRRTEPDVLLLDIEMPGMDGLTFLRQQMAEKPIPTVICSTLTEAGSKMALEALAAGALAVVAKPRLGLKQFLEDSGRELVQALKTAAQAKPRKAGAALAPRPGGTARPASAANLHALAMNKPVVLGSSTGGTQAIEEILRALPADSPGIAIVQHMPVNFTAMYAQRLNDCCAMQVREARDGDRLERGLVLIAPGGQHMQLRKAGGQYYAVVREGPRVNRHLPSVDVLFQSAADCAGADALAIMLTGMGNDGARGMKLMHDKGARTIAQDEASCVVFGMPQEAIKLGAVDDVMPLGEVARAIMRFDMRG